ncbi:uncharacterized protein K02A2.6-like [Sitophilus oryzae]|uniref:Uncharacterized protein K02A2.6-like n=1 Tax=Sitophilus oryzae TaxID=7048 RepID=A0A6J2YAT2_SITOR|nr:uncharacterized protein K02A2.6-like [Sitophilus oryzae]
MKWGHYTVNYSRRGTPIVPVLKDGSVRICGDFKVTVNPYIEIDQYPSPRINELFVKLQEGVHFSKLDLSNAYQQICLDQSSKELMTISTHKGLYQYNRAPFGIASIPAKFQKIMESLLQGLDGTVVFLNDILITGCNRKEHLIRLKKVLQILQESGLKISLPKCSFFQDQIEYLGFIINKEGLHTSDKKIKAIKDAEQPQNLQPSVIAILIANSIPQNDSTTSSSRPIRMVEYQKQPKRPPISTPRKSVATENFALEHIFEEPIPCNNNQYITTIRDYKHDPRSKVYKRTDEENLERALNEIKTGMSYRDASM